MCVLLVPEEVFPIKPVDKRSYAQTNVVWIRQAGLQSDIQKILRHARKLPDKTQHFYKVVYNTYSARFKCLLLRGTKLLRLLAIGGIQSKLNVIYFGYHNFQLTCFNQQYS